jgi:hypothetical protein
MTDGRRNAGERYCGSMGLKVLTPRLSVNSVQCALLLAWTIVTDGMRDLLDSTITVWTESTHTTFVS